MKRVFYFLLVAIFAISCEGPMGPMGPQGPAGNGGMPDALWGFEDFTITRWDKHPDGYFYAKYPVPNLTQRIYDEGVVVAYIETGSGTNKIKTQLPYTMQCKDHNTGYEWSEVIDFSYAPREITFFINPSDYDTGAGVAIGTPVKIHVIFIY